MFEKILVAVDGSALSDKAVEWAIRAYSELPEAEFTMLYAHQPVTPIAAGADYIPVVYESVSVDAPNETPSFDAWIKFPDKRRVKYRTEVGKPAEVICRTAEEGGYDLIVLGSQGHGLVASVLLGSVSSKVIHHAKCPVLIIR